MSCTVGAVTGRGKARWSIAYRALPCSRQRDFTIFLPPLRGAQAGSLRSPMWNPLRAWMKFPVDRFQALLIHVRVNLGRGDVGVAEHLLDDAQISAIAE